MQNVQHDRFKVQAMVDHLQEWLRPVSGKTVFAVDFRPAVQGGNEGQFYVLTTQMAIATTPVYKLGDETRLRHDVATHLTTLMERTLEDLRDLQQRDLARLNDDLKTIAEITEQGEP